MMNPVFVLDTFIRNAKKAKAAAPASGNCGIGAGGFQHGNTCAEGGGGGGTHGVADVTGHVPLGTDTAGKELDHLDKTINHPDVLKDFKPPDVMYHVTDRSNLESIMKHGLVPGKARATSIGHIRGSYLTDSPSIHELGKQGGDFTFKDPVVLAIKTKGLNLRLDPEYWNRSGSKATHADAKDFVREIGDNEAEYAAYSAHGIPSHHISVHKS